MKTGLVLGGGGLVGMGYHAGAIKALDEWGVDTSRADLIVGTSAGSVIGSYLAAGWKPSDFYAYAQGEHPKARRGDQDAGVQAIFTPLWSTRSERVRRSIGSFFALASSRGYWRRATNGSTPGAPLRHTFPAGMYSTSETRLRLHEDLPEEWPDRDVFICAVDLYTGGRIPFGHPDAPTASFPESVLASVAIPGVFPPVKIGDRQYVDGGAFSATSLDLAADAGCEAIICIAPLGYKSDLIVAARDPKLWGPMALRGLFARALRREVVAARERGIEVFVVRPWLTDLKTHGTNSMRNFDTAQFTDEARESTLRLLEDNADHPALKAFAKKRARTTEKAV
ncbi:MAG TPA: patatin-like phospholipase family protein [Actinomycetota bacterium]|nr:patatin-like phospholipase family protein [Actinomycetota bacterium]